MEESEVRRHRRLTEKECEPPLRVDARLHVFFLPCPSTSRLRTSGHGLNRVLTSVKYTGTKSFVLRLRLRKGSYRFVSDPHSGIMRGRFLVS